MRTLLLAIVLLPSVAFGASRAAVKSNFETGDTPTQAQFAELVDALSGTYSLAASTQVGDTTITLNQEVAPIAVGRGLLVIDPYTIEAELRVISSVAGETITIAALTYGHAEDDPVLFIPYGLVPWTLWGAKNTGNTADATANTTGFNRLTQQIYDIGVSAGITGIFIPNGSYYINNELKLERDQALVGANVNNTQILPTDDFPFTGTGEIAMIHPYRDGLPVKYDIPGPSGRWLFRDFHLLGRDLANSNGILTSPQQPDIANNLRIDDFAGLYGMCIADSQQYIAHNLEFIGNNVALRFRSAAFVWIHGLNIEQSITNDFLAETQVGGLACNHNHFTGVHLESPLTTGQVHFKIDSGQGWVFESVWLSNTDVAATLFQFNNGNAVAEEWPVFDLRNVRCNQPSTLFKMVDDTIRVESLTVTGENRVIPLIISGKGPEWGFHVGAEDVKINDVVQ